MKVVHEFFNFSIFLDTSNQRVGFSFLVTDGLHQTNAEWFSVERDKNKHVELDANVQLNAAPGVLTPIGPDYLRARVLDVSFKQTSYNIFQKNFRSHHMNLSIKLLVYRLMAN